MGRHRQALLAGLAAATLAAPLGGAAGGLLCAGILHLAALGILPDAAFDPSLVRYGFVVGLWPLAPLVPAILLAARLALRRLPRRRADEALGWVGFAAAGALPYLLVPGYDTLPLGLAAGIACAWAFAKAQAWAMRRGGLPGAASVLPPGP